jgi:hypothetical protein
VDYSSASFFDGYAFQHIAAYYDHMLAKRRARLAARLPRGLALS